MEIETYMHVTPKIVPFFFFALQSSSLDGLVVRLKVHIGRELSVGVADEGSPAARSRGRQV